MLKRSLIILLVLFGPTLHFILGQAGADCFRACLRTATDVSFEADEEGEAEAIVAFARVERAFGLSLPLRAATLVPAEMGRHGYTHPSEILRPPCRDGFVLS